MKPSDFNHVVEFPRAANVVYVFFALTAKNPNGQPFYVGQTANFQARMTDYFRGTFAAATDFKVGEVVRYLLSSGSRINVGYDEMPDRIIALKEEARIIQSIRSKGIRLLNDIGGYDYRSAVRESERIRLHTFCDEHILK